MDLQSPSRPIWLENGPILDPFFLYPADAGPESPWLRHCLSLFIPLSPLPHYTHLSKIYNVNCMTHSWCVFFREYQQT